MSTRHINTLLYNPFLGSEIITYFLSGYYEKDKGEIPYNTSHSYIILPFILNKPIREALKNCRDSSTLFSTFSQNIKKSSSLGGIEKVIMDMRPLSNQSLIVGHNKGYFEVKDTLKLVTRRDLKQTHSDIINYARPAFYLGRLLSKETSLIDVYENYIL